MISGHPTLSFKQAFLSSFFLCVLCDSVVHPPRAYAQREYGFDNTKPSGQPYLKPEESLKRMKIADGFEIHLAAAEPTIINPIAFTVDEKGRLWVVECFEYPKRTPKGQMPRDRIVILESTKGDGVYDKRTVFAEGKDFPMSFDMASGIEVGYGGVFLGAPPYLWFIENKNDKPGKFEVLLKGFGSQDTHEMLNTFQWGPDGWLYGLHGVFTSSEVVQGEPGASATGVSEKPKTQQKPPVADAPGSPAVKLNAGVWRYHPRTKKFEVFAEGTSNPWGMDWRNTDGEFILCCCVIPHLFHIVPGGIYKRQAGASFNPYAYGEIKEICDHTFHKESGWAHAGLISLDAPHIPEKWRNSVIFGSIHGCSVKQNILERKGSTFVAHRGDDFLVSGDKNFRPINLKWGPGGDIYLIDWHDQNPCHQAKPDAWDYEHGRIFRISVKGSMPKPAPDVRKLLKTDFLAAFDPKDPFLVRASLQAVREITVAGKKRQELDMAFGRKEEQTSANEFSWIWTATHFDDTTPRSTMFHLEMWLSRHPQGLGVTDEPVQMLRMIRSSTGELDNAQFRDLEKYTSLVQSESEVRELASLLQRYRNDTRARALLHVLLAKKQFSADPQIPLLVWLAYEANLFYDVEAELTWLKSDAPNNVLVTDHIVPRVMRRLIATGWREDRAACINFIEAVEDAAVRKRALEGLAEATKGQTFDAPPKWQAVYKSLLADKNPDVVKLARTLAVSFRDPAAVKHALAVAADAAKALPERIDAIRAIGTLKPDDGARLLLNLANGGDPTLQLEAVRALGGYANQDIAKELLANWAKYPSAVRAEAANVLATRKDSARQLLDAVGAKKVARKDLTDNTILRIRSFNDGSLNKRIEEVWGKFRATPKELDDLINKMRTSLYAGPASFAHGKQVFEQHCAKCHKFEGRGAEVGPPLDGASRDIEYLLGNVLDPNRVIGQPYFVHVVERKNGTSEVGLLVAEDPQTITLKVENAVQKVIAKADIESHTVQEKSLMPEGLTKGMTDQDFRDLLRYVMANPFIIRVTLDGKPLTVGTPGRIPLAAGETTVVAEVTAAGAMKTKLQLGGNAELEVKLNGKVVYQGRPGEDRPDAASADVELAAGANRIEVRAKSKTKSALYVRLLDPDRKLKYPE
jgi:putative membrane-bound dehydrogenase-like protein